MTLIFSIIACAYVFGGAVTAGCCWYAVNYQWDLMAEFDPGSADEISRASTVDLLMFYLFAAVVWPAYWLLRD